MHIGRGASLSRDLLVLYMRAALEATGYVDVHERLLAVAVDWHTEGSCTPLSVLAGELGAGFSILPTKTIVRFRVGNKRSEPSPPRKGCIPPGQ